MDSNTEATPLLLESNSSKPVATGIGRIVKFFRGPERLWTVFFATMIASLASFSFGYGIGFLSPALIQLTDPIFIRNVSHANFHSATLEDIFGGMLAVGAAIGGLTFGFIADLIGRKIGMMIMGLFYLVGWAVIALSRLASGTAFFGVIYTGVLIVGYGCGSATLIVPMYISEVAPANWRGFLGCIPELNAVIGTAIVYAFGAIPFEDDSYNSLSYYYLALIAFSIILLAEILLLTVKESPHWLVHKGKEPAALESLKWFRGHNVNVSSELETLKTDLHENKELTYLQTLKMFPQRTVWKPFLLVLIVLIFQELVGISAVIFYGGPIFQVAGFENPNEVAAGSIGAFQVLGTIFCLFLADVIGRKVLLLLSSGGLIISTFSVGAYFFVYESHGCDHLNTTALIHEVNFACDTAFSWLAILSLALYTFAFTLGWGGIPWLLSSEMFPMAVRGKCMSIVTCVNWIMSIIVSFSFNSYQEAVQPYGAFWTFGIICTLSFLFVLLFLPETKGKTLHEIENYFARAQRQVHDASMEQSNESTPM